MLSPALLWVLAFFHSTNASENAVCNQPIVIGAGGVEVTSFTINGECTDELYVVQGEEVNIHLQYYNLETVCTGCYEQVYVGIQGQPLECIFHGNPDGHTADDHTITIPTNANLGTYVIVAKATWEYSCLTFIDGTTIATVHVVGCTSNTDCGADAFCNFEYTGGGNCENCVSMTDRCANMNYTLPGENACGQVCEGCFSNSDCGPDAFCNFDYTRSGNCETCASITNRCTNAYFNTQLGEDACIEECEVICSCVHTGNGASLCDQSNNPESITKTQCEAFDESNQCEWQCSVRHCHVPEHYSTDCGDILVGTSCDIMFDCEGGLFSEAVTQTCTHSGDWSGPNLNPNCQVRHCNIPEHYSTNCNAILEGSSCDIKFDCEDGYRSEAVTQTCTQSGDWVGPALDPNCQARECILPSVASENIVYGSQPMLEQCNSANCDDYILHDVDCNNGLHVVIFKCTTQHSVVSVECDELMCYEDECRPRNAFAKLEIFNNFYHGINIADPFKSSYGHNIFKVIDNPEATVDKWNRDLIDIPQANNEDFYFLVEKQFSRDFTGAEGHLETSKRSYSHYNAYVDSISETIQHKVGLEYSMLGDDNQAYASIGVAGSHMTNRATASGYSELVKFSASQFTRKQVFATWKFNPSHSNVEMNPDLVNYLINIPTYDVNPVAYEALFDQYGSHYAVSFDFGYEINAAEFSSECGVEQSTSEYNTREYCFETSFSYKFMGGTASRCQGTTSASSSSTEGIQTFQSASFEVRGGSAEANRILVDDLATMRTDGDTRYTESYDNWIESTYVNPGIVDFTAQPIWHLASTHSELIGKVRDTLATDLREAYYDILQRKETDYRRTWCKKECKCGVQVDPITCTCDGCFQEFGSEFCCSSSTSFLDPQNCVEPTTTTTASEANIARFGFAIFFAVFCFRI